MTTHTPRLLVRLAALVAATTLVLGVPALASAAELVHVDPAHDAYVSRFNDEQLRPSPASKHVDVRRVRVRYDADRLVIRLSTRAPLPRRDFGIIGTIRTPSGTYDVEYTHFYGESRLAVMHAYEDVACPGLRATNDRSRNLVRVVVPASCFGAPRWTRVGVGAVIAREDRYYVDDAFSRRVGDEPRLSARIARG